MIVISIFLVSMICFLLTMLYTKTKRPPFFPPGPPTVPFIGNLNLDLRKSIELFRDFRKKYGDIFSLILGKRTVIVVCGSDKIHEALVKHADVTSDRPDDFLFKDLFLSMGVVSSSGKSWQDMRSTLIKAFRHQGVGKNETETIILREVKIFLDEVKEKEGKPFDITQPLHISIANVISSITHSCRYAHDDQYIAKLVCLIEDFLVNPNTVGPLTFLPFLKYVPFDWFQGRQLRRMSDELRDHCRNILRVHRKNFNAEELQDVLDHLIDKQNAENETSSSSYTDDKLVQTFFELFMGGTDTTGTTLRWFILFMIKNPDVQIRMRREIEENVGTEAFVSWKDRSCLHYCEAVIHETLRMGNISPFNLPHRVSKEFTLNDYVIPKDAILLPSIDSLNFDLGKFDDVECFNPERFIDEKGGLVRTNSIMPFSTGRRVCIGESLARMELFLFATNIVQTFKLLPERDGLEPSIDYNFGVVHAPKPFKLRAVHLRKLMK